MKNKSIAFMAVVLAVTACGTPTTPPAGVSSQGQSGGVTANSVGTVNQTIPPHIPSPYLKHLQELYAQGGQIERAWRFIPQTYTDQDINALATKSASWVNDTYNWISKNMTAAAAERFVQITPDVANWTMKGGKFSDESQKEFSDWYKGMPQFLANLDALMRSDEMYPQ